MLRDCDFGRWAGRSLEEIHAQEPDALAQWIKDPQAAPHGGETFADVLSRVGGWMESLLDRSETLCAITHPMILRAAITFALGASPGSFRHIDIAPLSRVRLSNDGNRWTLGALIPLKDAR